MRRMISFDESSSVCRVYVYNEGILTAFGHDLCIEVRSYNIEIAEDASSINAVFDARSLHVGCAIVNGAEHRMLLKPEEKKEIDRNIFWDILDAGKFGEIAVRSSSVIREESCFLVNALLTLHGSTKDISFRVARSGNHVAADIPLHLPDFGIKPFRAMFGALRIKPDILIRLMIPAGPLKDLLSFAGV